MMKSVSAGRKYWHYILLISHMPNSKKWKGAIITVTGIFVIALGGWQFYKYSIVNRKVNEAVSGKSGGLYTIHYEGLVIDEVRGILHVKNIRILPDTAVFNRMVAEKREPSVLVGLTIPSLDIMGIKTPKALLTKQIEGSSIEIRNPSIEIMLSRFQKDTTVYDPARDISQQLLGKLFRIKIDSVKISHANVLVRKMYSPKLILSGDNISCLLSDLLIDSTTGKDSSRLFFSRNLEINGDQILFPSKNEKYKLHIGDIRFRSQNNSLYIGKVQLVPRLGEAEFASSFPVQKDRYDFSFGGISLLHLDRGGLWHKRIEADSLVIRSSSFKIYHDLSYPHDTVSKVGKYPQQQLMYLPIPINIRKIIFLQSFIEYKEKNPKSDSAGKLQFFNVAATISNVTNMKTAIARNNKCDLLFKAKFLNKAPVTAKLAMLYKDPQGKFNIEGDIGAIDAASLNALTEPMGLARIERGHIDHLHFNIDGTDSSSSGKLVMLYRDLKVSLLKKDKKENKYDKKVLASLAAAIIMKKENPKGGDTRVADIHLKRILNKSFFNLIWKSIFTGIKETAGIK
jgi:hypothetical protein